MKKYAFPIILFVYITIGATGVLRFAGTAYLENRTWNRVISDHAVELIFSAVITGVILFYLYKHFETEKYNQRENRPRFRMITLTLYVFLAFILNMGALFHTDSLVGNKGTLWIKGRILNRDVRRSPKGRNEYFMNIFDELSKHAYYFKVRKIVYERYENIDTINKQFIISRLGVIYRKEL